MPPNDRSCVTDGLLTPSPSESSLTLVAAKSTVVSKVAGDEATSSAITGFFKKRIEDRIVEVSKRVELTQEDIRCLGQNNWYEKFFVHQTKTKK